MVSSRRRNCESASKASSPPRTLSNAGRRALMRVAHVTRRSNPSTPATSCASRGTSRVRMLRTDADDIGDVELFIAHEKRKARRLSPRWRCGRGAAGLLRLPLLLVFLANDQEILPVFHSKNSCRITVATLHKVNQAVSETRFYLSNVFTCSVAYK